MLYRCTSTHCCDVQTGASTGIGKALAHTLAGNGFRVALIARSTNKLDSLQKELKKQHGDDICHFYTLDVQDQQKAKQTIDAIVTHFGRIDVLINNVSAGSGKTLDSRC